MAIKKSTKDFIEKSNLIHSGFYDYSKVDYQGSHSFIVISCPIHGCFTQRATNHLQGRGCGGCSIEKLSMERRLGWDEFVLKARSLHGDRFNYPLNGDYINNHTKVVVVCQTHGEFLITPNSHLDQLGGCLKCAISSRMIDAEGRARSERYRIFSSRVMSNLNTRIKPISGFHRDHKYPVKAFWDHGILDLEIINHPYNIQYISPEENRAKWDYYNIDAFRLRFGVK